LDAATAYFLFAKLMGFMLNPWAMFVAGLFVSYVLLITQAGLRWGRILLSVVLLCFVAFGMFPTGTWALNVLEERFPTRTHINGPIEGILVLGGSVNTVITRERDQVSVGSNVTRLTSFLRLARENPDAKRLYVGGQGRVFDRKPTEAEVAKRFLDELGMDTSQVMFEDNSRNTEEGAKQAYELVQPGDRPWVLITSASHMPRAVGLYRQAGWNVIAYPVAYRTLPTKTLNWSPRWPGSLGASSAALYEWAALTMAWMRGKIAEPFPGPQAPTFPAVSSPN